jgi:hypothetical protein
MKTTITITILALLTITSLSFASKEVPFTLEDRDRLIRVEIKVESNEKRLESIDRRIERLENIMMWGFGLLFTTMIGLVGFVIWDRRSALAPAIRKNKELEEREEKIERALKEAALKDPNLAEALKRAGL